MKKPENLRTIPRIKSLCLGIFVSMAMLLPARASADDITLNLKNVTVKRAIAVLQQSHYSLTVDASRIDLERRITVTATNQPVEEVLAQIFAGQDVSYEINGRSIVVTRRTPPPSGQRGARADAARYGARRQGRCGRRCDGRRQGDDHRRDDRHRRPLFAARGGG